MFRNLSLAESVCMSATGPQDVPDTETFSSKQVVSLFMDNSICMDIFSPSSITLELDEQQIQGRPLKVLWQT